VDLVRAVASLAPQQRAAVALYYLEDLPVEEVAHLLGVSASTVKQHLHRARARLATLLSEAPEEVVHDAD
jgi:RNA polymerase sigma-70 factor (ECF subfamily)